MTGRDDVRVDGREPPSPSIGLVIQDFGGAPEAAGIEALEQAARAAERLAPPSVRSPCPRRSRTPS